MWLGFWDKRGWGKGLFISFFACYFAQWKWYPPSCSLHILGKIYTGMYVPTPQKKMVKVDVGFHFFSKKKAGGEDFKNTSLSHPHIIPSPSKKPAVFEK